MPAGRLGESVGDRQPGPLGQLVEAAQDAYSNALAHEVGRFAPDGRLEQGEERLDLVIAARPVLATEGVDRQRLDAQVGCVLDDRTDGVDAG